MDTTPSTTDELIGLSAASQLARRSERTVLRWVREGRVLGGKQVGRVLIDRASLDALLAGRPIRPHEPPALWGVYTRPVSGAEWEQADRCPTKPAAERVARQLRSVAQVLVWRGDREPPATAESMSN